MARTPELKAEFIRFDELLGAHIIRRVLDLDLYEVQRLYPQIYLACHTNHVRSSSTKWKLSSHDSSILAHLDLKEGMSPRSLAAHLGVVPSTLSAAITRLEKLGYLKSEAVAADRRRKRLRLTTLGAEAMASTSVLDGERVRLLLSRLSPAERKAAVKGLALLARAARELEETK
jgi:DNA-binding MarR family transcriptional regulator